MEKFYFMLTEKVEGVNFRDLGDIYEAVLNDGFYTVHWFEYGEHFSTEYPICLVEASLKHGYWVKLTESEVEDVIKGLY